MFSRAIALLSCRFTASKRPQDVVSLFTSFYLRSKRYARKKYARLKLKLPTQNGELIVVPFPRNEKRKQIPHKSGEV